MTRSAVVCACCLAFCNGLSVPPEASDEGRRFAQTGVAQRQRIEVQGGAEASNEAVLHQQRAEAEASHTEAMMEKLQEGLEYSMKQEGLIAEREANDLLRNERIMEGRARRKAGEGQSLRVTAERQKQKEQAQAKHEEREARHKDNAARRVEEKKLAQEEWEAAQKFRAAQKAVAEKQIEEKLYRANFIRHGTEMAANLWMQADGVRAKAEQGQPDKDAIVRLLGNSSEAITDLVSGLVLAASDRHFRALVDGLRLKPSPAEFMEDIKHKTDAFVIASQGVNEKQFVPVLAKFLNESQKDLRKHEESAAEIGNSLKFSAPEQLKKKLALLLSNVTVSSTLIDVDTHELARSNSSEACSALAHTFAEAVPQYTSLAQMKEVLDTTSKMVPMMVGEFPKTKYEVAPMAQALLNMAYAEHIALKEASSAFISKATPIIVDRLGCTFSGAIPRAGYGLLAVAFSMAAAMLTF